MATEITPTMIEEMHEGDNNALNNDWIKPKNTASIKNFDKKSKCKEEHEVGNVQSNNLMELNTNKFNALSCEDEKEEKTEHCEMECEDESSGVMDKKELDVRDKRMS